MISLDIDFSAPERTRDLKAESRRLRSQLGKKKDEAEEEGKEKEGKGLRAKERTRAYLFPPLSLMSKSPSWT